MARWSTLLAAAPVVAIFACHGTDGLTGGTGDAGTTDAATADDAGAESGATVPTTGLAVRLEAASDTLTVTDGGVSLWSDTSGQGRHASQSDPTRRPTIADFGGRTVVRLDGVDDFLAFGVDIQGLDALTLTMVTAATADLSPGVNGQNFAALFWEEDESWGQTHLSPFPSQIRFRFGTTQVGNLPSYTRPTSIGSQLTLTTAIHDGTIDRLYVDRLLAVETPGRLASLRGTMGTGWIGRGVSSTFFQGDVVAIFVYGRALSEAERDALERYLRDRYRLP